MRKEFGKQIIQILGIAVLASALPGLATQPPTPVSPGNGDGIAIVATPCPTFSWVPQARAQAQELVVYELFGEANEATEGDLRIGDGTYRLKIGVATAGGGAGAANIHAHGGLARINLGSAGTHILQIDPTDGVYPGADNTYALGKSGNKWTEVWATNGTIQTSDRRLKRDIANLDYGLAELLALRPVSFRWKDRSGNARHLGFVAQEAEEVVPEVVRAGEGEDAILGMSYAELVPLLVRAIQEQQEQIARQQTTIESQRLEIDSLRALEDRITALESSGSPRDPR